MMTCNIFWGEREEHLQQVEPKLDRDATLHQMDIIVHYQLLPERDLSHGRELDWFQIGVRHCATPPRIMHLDCAQPASQPRHQAGVDGKLKVKIQYVEVMG